MSYFGFNAYNAHHMVMILMIKLFMGILEYCILSYAHLLKIGRILMAKIELVGHSDEVKHEAGCRSSQAGLI